MLPIVGKLRRDLQEQSRRAIGRERKLHGWFNRALDTWWRKGSVFWFIEYNLCEARKDSRAPAPRGHSTIVNQHQNCEMDMRISSGARQDSEIGALPPMNS
jgi:hypothetical protein